MLRFDRHHVHVCPVHGVERGTVITYGNPDEHTCIKWWTWSGFMRRKWVVPPPAGVF